MPAELGLAVARSYARCLRVTIFPLNCGNCCSASRKRLDAPAHPHLRVTIRISSCEYRCERSAAGRSSSPTTAPGPRRSCSMNVPEFRYRAFISYSHQDRAWADWLHRALETYRVPRRLVGRRTEIGIIPKRIAPVFRDREELA